MENGQNRKLKIAQVAPLWFPLPPQKYGGVERVVSVLTEELVRRGHEVTLFASGDSKTSAKLMAGWPNAISRERSEGKIVNWSNCVLPLFNFSLAFEHAHEFDILHVHENNKVISNFLSGLIQTPMVTTVHDPFPTKKENKNRWAVFNKYKDNRYVCISKSHQSHAQKEVGLLNTEVVYNGIDVASFPFEKRAGKYLVWLGRTAPNKGAKEAILAAKKLKMPLVLAGRVDVNSPVALAYFQKEIKPRLGGGIRFIGEIGEAAKRKLLKSAIALLYPIHWEEPFGLVMVEAMACGVPVIAFGRGSVSEVVENGKTGFIVEDVRGMIAAVKNIGAIERSECRRWVEQRFTVEKMVDSYEKVYKKIINENKEKA